VSAPQPDSQSDPTPAADGRVPGRRGRATRQKLLDATAALLETTSYRELKVVDIARKAGTSPATFYQYFSDVELAILSLGEVMVADGPVLAEPVQLSWSGKSGFDTALRLVEGFLDFWEEHEAVLRVVDLAIVEGDRRFRRIRNELLAPVTFALIDVVTEHQKAGKHPDTVDPRAHAAVLLSMLAHVAEHRHGLEAWGVSGAQARESMARIVAWSVTGRRPGGS
jgi:AcrR family transcriptional regulator